MSNSYSNNHYFNIILLQKTRIMGVFLEFLEIEYNFSKTNIFAVSKTIKNKEKYFNNTKTSSAGVRNFVSYYVQYF